MSKRELDKHFARNGPCVFHPTRYARHRLIDTIRSRYRAGDTVEELARDYGLSREAVKAAIRSKSDDSRMTKKEIKESCASAASPCG